MCVCVCVCVCTCAHGCLHTKLIYTCPVIHVHVGIIDHPAVTLLEGYWHIQYTVHVYMLVHLGCSNVHVQVHVHVYFFLHGN